MNREQRQSRQEEEEQEEEQDNFYDCEETLEPAHCKKAELQHGYIRPETLTDRGEEPRGGHQEEQRDKLLKEEQEQRDRLQEEEEQKYKLQKKKEEQSDRLQEEEQSDRLQEEEEEQSHRLQEEEQSDRLQEEKQSDRLQEEQQSDRLQEEQQSDRLQEEQQSDRLQEEEEDLDSEMRQEEEFDDDYLREVEKELTDEEKESRRQQSLTLKETGNRQFKSAEWASAEQTYSQALRLCPLSFSEQRSILFSNRAAARAHMDEKERAISDCSRAIALNPDYVRALLRRAELYEQTEKLDEALDDYKKVLDLEPDNSSATGACVRLPQQIQDRNEKLKEEMMSKLKDLGNMILRPFGLSTNNFQVNQDQNTGSYSVNFVQNNNNNR